MEQSNNDDTDVKNTSNTSQAQADIYNMYQVIQGNMVLLECIEYRAEEEIRKEWNSKGLDIRIISSNK